MDVSHFFPPAYGVWREGNVFSLSVHRGGPPSWVTPPPPTGGAPGVPPPPPTKNGQSFGQKMDKKFDKILDKKFDKHFGNFWRWGGGAVRLLRSRRRTVFLFLLFKLNDIFASLSLFIYHCKYHEIISGSVCVNSHNQLGGGFGIYFPEIKENWAWGVPCATVTCAVFLQVKVCLHLPSLWKAFYQSVCPIPQY